MAAFYGQILFSAAIFPKIIVPSRNFLCYLNTEIIWALGSTHRSFSIVTHEGLLPTGIVLVGWQQRNQQLQLRPKPCYAHYFSPTLKHTEGSAINCVY